MRLTTGSDATPPSSLLRINKQCISSVRFNIYSMNCLLHMLSSFLFIYFAVDGKLVNTTAYMLFLNCILTYCISRRLENYRTIRTVYRPIFTSKNPYCEAFKQVDFCNYRFFSINSLLYLPLQPQVNSLYMLVGLYLGSEQTYLTTRTWVKSEIFRPTSFCTYF